MSAPNWPMKGIDERLAADAPLEEICHLMVNGANARGGLDNVTVVLLQVEDRAEAAPTLALPHLSGRLDPTLSGAWS